MSHLMNTTTHAAADEIACRASNKTGTIIQFKAIREFRVVQFYQWNTAGTATLPYDLLDVCAASDGKLLEAVDLIIHNISQTAAEREVAAGKA